MLIEFIITDLSKAFNCLQHRLLIAKLKAYRLDESACVKFVSIYFTRTMQKVKVAASRSYWRVINCVRERPKVSI